MLRTKFLRKLTQPRSHRLLLVDLTLGTRLKIDLFVISVPDPTTGDTTDWTFGVLGVIHSYCVELRPKTYSEGGFILSPDKIIPVGEETFAGLKALTRNMWWGRKNTKENISSC